jgi:drug/metabolite transporter (DMT)-like permease
MSDRDETYVETDEAYRDVDEPNPNERGKWLSALIALIGLWLILEAFLFDLVASQVWNDFLVGALLVIAGGYNYYRRADEQLGSVGAAALAALLGVWLVAAPFIFGASAGFTEAVNDAGFWNDVVIGLVVFVLGAYSAYEIRDRREQIRTATT